MDELLWAPKEQRQGFGNDGRRFKQNVDQLLVIGALYAVEKIQKSRLLSEAPRNKISSFVLIRDVRTRLLLAGLFSSDFFIER